MMNDMLGMPVYSKAGHDRQTVYIVIKEEADTVWLCDGRLKPIAHPKKKSKKHIQPIKKGVDAVIREKLLTGSPVRDEEIKRAIKVFSKGKEETDV